MNFLNQYFNYENNTIINGFTSELNVIYVVNLFNLKKRNLIVLTSSLYEANNYYNLFQTYTDKVLLFPMDDFLSSMVKISSPELKLTRLNTLNSLESGCFIIIVNLTAYLKFLPNFNEEKKRKITLCVNDKIERQKLISNIIDLGYVKESVTSCSGEFSVRGMIIDIFLVNEMHPIRIEIDDDIIGSIRYFDESTQRSLEYTDKIVLKPINENTSEEVSSIYEYSGNPIVVKIDNDQINASYFKLQEDILEYSTRNLIKEKLMFSLENINEKEVLYLNTFNSPKKGFTYQVQEIDNFNGNYELLKTNIDKWLNDDKNIYFCSCKNKQINNIIEINPNIHVINKTINKGFIIDNNVVISEFDIENIKHEYKYHNNFYGGKKITNYNELTKGDYIVHVAHGIGIYNGIVSLKKNGIEKDYIQLLYLGNDKIYIPVEKINNIYKYSDKDGSAVKLNHINSTSWLKTRAYVQKKVEDISKELIILYKKRIGIKKIPYKHYEEEDIFAYEFKHELTSDQKKAIKEIYSDLTSGHPMDRLLCGDVGFGKTEVAMRAMFKAVLNNEQVIYLCPTTILSNQQYNVAKERFASWPIEIALLNRFTSTKEENIILEKLAKGQIDILFGTHKILNDKIRFKKLGLMIVDEEQRFGVKHKEKIKNLKEDINVLTLSATPIPRTLKMALSGLRDLSIISSPPKNRYPVQTYVLSEDDLIIKDAIYKELSRNGQIFILFNNVENIKTKVDSLRILVPHANIGFAHGQMDKNDLAQIMEDFINQKYRILVCTTIIENGIDIPLANTLIVYDADRLGLSQLYQLRGRVGRSDRIAYAYLMYNSHKMLNEIAMKRLQAIKQFTELGSGYKIAMRDLSIRGSGDIFGSSQAGFVDSVGISLYMKMIEDEMAKQKGEYIAEEADEQALININTHIDDNYVSDEDIKIEIHRLINEIDSLDKLTIIKETIEDRFGKIDENMENYMYEEWFEKIAQKLGITKVKQTDRFVEVVLPEKTSKKVDGNKLLYESYSISHNFNLAYKHNEIIITLYLKNLTQHFIRYFTSLLSTIE